MTFVRVWSVDIKQAWFFLFISYKFTRTVYNVLQPKPLGPDVQRLYDQYKKTFEDYISSKVLPSLRGRKNEDLSQELLRRWNNHKIMMRWLSRFFLYIDRYFIVKKNLPSLVETSHMAFYNLVTAK